MLEHSIIINPSSLDNLPLKPNKIIKLQPNSYSLTPIEFFDPKLDFKFKILFFVGLKTSPFLSNPKGTITFKIPPEIEDKLI